MGIGVVRCGVLSDETCKNRIRAYLPRYPRKQAVTLPALHLVHDELRYVPTEAIVEIADILDLHPSEVQDTMTFYEFFKDEDDKLGKTRLWVCRGLACMLRGAYELLDHCEHKLGVRCGETTAGRQDHAGVRRVHRGVRRRPGRAA